MVKKKQHKKHIWKWLLFIAIAVIIVEVSQSVADNRQSVIILDTNEIENVIIPEEIPNDIYRYTGFTVHFNRETHIPNCTVHELTREEVNGTSPRNNNFHQDENVVGCPTLDDYKFSGYDRGHMVPAGDMKWDKQAMSDCFSLANMIPQKKALNSGAWNKLEQKFRDWANRDSAIIVITGPIVTKDDLNITIGESRVVVPSFVFKIALAPFVTPMRAIAFIYPNKKATGGLDKHVVSVDKVENATGMDFFPSLPDEIENVVEASSDLNQWNVR